MTGPVAQALVALLVVAGLVILPRRERRRRERLYRVLHEHVGRQVDLTWGPTTARVSFPTTASGFIESIDEVNELVILRGLEIRNMGMPLDTYRVEGRRGVGIPILEIHAVVSDRRYRF